MNDDRIKKSLILSSILPLELYHHIYKFGGISLKKSMLLLSNSIHHFIWNKCKKISYSGWYVRHLNKKNDDERMAVFYKNLASMIPPYIEKLNLIFCEIF